MPRYDAFTHLGYAVFRRQPGGGFYVRKGRLFRSLETPVRDQARIAVEALQAESFNRRIFGDRATATFAHAANSYIQLVNPSPGDARRLERLLQHFGAALLSKIDQAAIDKAATELTKPGSKPSTKTRAVYAPVRAILIHAAKRGWCNRPMLDVPRQDKTRASWLKPSDAARLIATAADHLKPVFIVGFGTGARVSELLDLRWDDVDLGAGTVVFRDTKGKTGEKKDRIVRLPPAAIVALANIKHRDGEVFRRDDGEPYAERVSSTGGHYKTGWRSACRRAGLICWQKDEGKGRAKTLDVATGPCTPIRWEPTVTPHGKRHSWASWYYAATRDPMRLQIEGGWSELSLVERYAHAMSSELVPSIALVWGVSHPDHFPAAVAARANHVQAVGGAG